MKKCWAAYKVSVKIQRLHNNHPLQQKGVDGDVIHCSLNLNLLKLSIFSTTIASLIYITLNLPLLSFCSLKWTCLVFYINYWTGGAVYPIEGWNFRGKLEGWRSPRITSGARSQHPRQADSLHPLFVRVRTHPSNQKMIIFQVLCTLYNSTGWMDTLHMGIRYEVERLG